MNDFKKIEKSLKLNYKLYSENETDMILKNLYNRIHPSILKDMNEGDDPVKFMKDNMKKTDMIHSNFDSEVLLDFEEMKISENNKNNEFNPNPWRQSDFSRSDMLNDPWRKYDVSRNDMIISKDPTKDVEKNKTDMSINDDVLLKQAIANVLGKKEKEYNMVKSVQEQAGYVKNLYGMKEKKEDNISKDFVKLYNEIGYIEDRNDFIENRAKYIQKHFGTLMKKMG